MKKILFINVLMLVAAFPIFGQSVWNRIPLTGPAAKILSTIRQPRFHISFTGSLPLSGIASQNLGLAALQNAAFSPGTAEKLFEKLGGEFFIGSPSGQYSQTVEMAGQTQFMPGLRLGFRLGQQFEIQAGTQYFRAEWSGEFPVRVFPFHQQQQPLPPITRQGSVSAFASGILLNIETVFFVAERGIVRPYVKGGVRGQISTENSSSANIEGVLLSLEIKPIETSFSPFGGVGTRVYFGKNVFFDSGISFAKTTGGKYGAETGIGIGLGF